MEEPEQPGKKDADSRFLALGLRYSGIGFEFVVALLVFGYLGRLVDQKYGSDPWGLFVGLLLGMGLGLFIMIRQLNKLNR
ncbi:MAG TPA: AtpZ/AtpI family protein [Phycisphaerae bacterium]|nr:AtpZ/AtpI family protein [Phycisphaerae bacterium]